MQNILPHKFTIEILTKQFVGLVGVCTNILVKCQHQNAYDSSCSVVYAGYQH